jgi:hypothetical protein
LGARWRDRYSNVVRFRTALRPMWLGVRWPGSRTWHVVYVSRSLTLTGRVVELQRKTADGNWVRVRRARLVRDGAGGSSVAYVVTFKIPTQGLTLRVFTPSATGRPCYDAGVSPEFRS